MLVVLSLSIGSAALAKPPRQEPVPRFLNMSVLTDCYAEEEWNPAGCLTALNDMVDRPLTVSWEHDQYALIEIVLTAVCRSDQQGNPLVGDDRPPADGGRRCGARPGAYSESGHA
jgi:hypothetical protein